MSNKEILRYYPKEINELNIPFRYTKKLFIKFNKYKETNNYNNYKLWKNGINYKTNRKINIDGKLYKKIGKEFYIKKFSIHIKDLENIDQKKYILETKKIKNKIKIENIIIKKYQLIRNDIIIKINNLNDWNKYIIFNNYYYGIHERMNNIHKKNNCNGNIDFINKFTIDTKFYSCFETNFISYNLLKCNKCNKEFKIENF